MNIKIYADGANLDEIKELNKNPLISGYTVNPTLMKKAGITDYEGFCRETLKYIDGKPISYEVFSDDFNEMFWQAKKIASFGKNVYVKIPVTNTEGLKSNQLITKLVREGIKINVTAVLTKRQIEETIQSLGDFDSIISIFAGRVADTGVDPRQIVKHGVIQKYPKQKILWASCREILNIIQADECNADIITVPNDILKKMNLIGKSLEELSLDTIKMFYNDAVQSGYKL